MLEKIRVKDYLALISPYINQNMNLSLALEPFQIFADATTMDLPFGFLCDLLMDEYGQEALIDAFDVASALWELGLESGLTFLEQGPNQILSQMLPFPMQRIS